MPRKKVTKVERKFTLQFDMGNAAFDDNPIPEVRRILIELSKGLHEAETSGNIWDINGNTIGTYTIDYDPA